jgi:hypothetical protein
MNFLLECWLPPFSPTTGENLRHPHRILQRRNLLSAALKHEETLENPGEAVAIPYPQSL